MGRLFSQMSYDRSLTWHSLLADFTIGTITISEDLTFYSDQLTLTCISTGGPATNVSWTRDSTTVITEGTETVLNDTVTALYTHTLNVTTAGEYTCTVANNKPSTATSNSFTVTGMYKVFSLCL